MEKTATMNLRVNPNVKKQAEDVLAQLGIPMSTAIDMYLKQIFMTGGIPFPVTLPKAPASIDIDLMSDEVLYTKIMAGMKDVEEGKVQNAKDAFEEFRKAHY